MVKDFAKLDSRGSRETQQSMRGRLSAKAAHAARLDDLAPNPLNPRYSTNDAEIAGLASTMAVGSQYQAAVVIERKIFVEACPDKEEQLSIESPEAKWVIVIGNRRHAAAKVAGITTLDIRVDPNIRTAEDIDRAMLVENSQRTALPPLPEARVLERMVGRPGATLRTVAEQIGKSHAYVAQRISLLSLIPEFQKMLQSDSLPIKTARRLAVLDEQRQRAVLEKGQPYLDEAGSGASVTAVQNVTETTPQATEPMLAASEAERAAPLNDVNPVTNSVPPSDEPSLLSDSVKEATSVNRVTKPVVADGQDVPVPVRQRPDTGTSFTAPVHDPARLAQLIRQHLTSDEVAQLIEALMEAV